MGLIDFVKEAGEKLFGRGNAQAAMAEAKSDPGSEAKAKAANDAAGDAILAYIKAQNHATETSRQAVQALIPEAEKCGVVIALENVWNNLWVMPDFFAAFVKSFDSPWVKAYLDLGNHAKYAPTPLWIEALGEHIAKCHVKDFRLNPDGKGGDFVDIRDGSNDWPAIRTALERVGYSGWLTIEGSGGLTLAEQNRRLDLIVRGE